MQERSRPFDSSNSTTSTSWPFAARIQPFSDITTVIGSFGHRSSSVNAAGFVDRSERRAARVAVRFGVGQQLLLDQRLQPRLRLQRLVDVGFLGVELVALGGRASFLRAAPVDADAGRESRSLGFPTARSAPSVPRAGCLPRERCGSTSSMLRYAMSRPSRMCSRCSILVQAMFQPARAPLRCRNTSHSRSISASPFTRGRMSSPITFRLTR